MDEPRPLRVTLLDRSLDSTAAMWGDPSGGWVEPAVAWAGVLAGSGVPFRVARTLDDAAVGHDLLIVADAERDSAALDRADDRGRPWLSGAPPTSMTAALALVRDGLGALVRPDLRGVLMLRLDDPGASARRHLESWIHDDVPPETWRRLWSALEGFGRLSVFCCPGWAREDGTVVPSREASPAEWLALDEGVSRGIADLECHGLAHVNPETARWAAAPDRTTNEAWYREFWPPSERYEPSVEAQSTILEQWQAACGPGTTVVAPGEAWGTNTIAAARRRGFQLFNSWAVCRLQTAVPTWLSHVVSPYLDCASDSWFESGAPVVGYWHDRDMAINGPAWLDEHLDAWRDCGAKRAWAFADLATAYATEIEATLERGHVEVHAAPRVPLLIEQR